ncbi:MAG: response regulator transcription factor [Thermoleophilia bacterium]
MEALAHDLLDRGPRSVDELWDALAATSLLPAPPGPTTVVLADDHPLFRDGLARAVSSHDDLRLVGEAEDGLVAVALVEELEPDVALLDVRMPGLDGVEACRAILRRRRRPTRVVLLSGHADGWLEARARAAGAAGFLSKDASRAEICEALVEVAAGGTVFAGTRREC